MTSEAQVPASTPRSLIVEWASKQDAWVRAMVAEILDSRADLPPERIDHFYEQLLREKELREGGQAPAVTLSIPVASAASGTRLTLLSLQDVRNVNRLAADQDIAFNSRMTVLFGENASGKTGYVRVLKRAAAVRAAEPVLPDVNVPRAAPKKPEARLRYKLDDKEGTIEWHDEEGVYPLNRLDVFDSRSTALYVDDDLTYRYTPGELAFFPITQKALEAVRRKLDEEITRRKPRTNPFLPHFARGSSLYTQIESLGPASDLAGIRSLGTVSDPERQRARELEQQLEALRSSTPKAQQRLAEEEAKTARGLAMVAEAAIGFDLAVYDGLLQSQKSAKEELSRARALPLGKLGVPDALRPAWDRFVTAGEEYLTAMGGQERYPSEGDSCIYCRQPLLEEAIDVLRQYRAYCDGQLRQAVASAEADLAAHADALATLDIAGGIRVIDEQSAAHAADAVQAALLSELKAAFSRLRQMQEAVKGRAPFAPDGLFAHVSELVTKLRARASAAERLATELKTRVEDRATIIAEHQKELDALKARLVLEQHLGGIDLHVREAKWASKAEQHSKRFQSLLRSLTEASKIASDELLNRDFERRFREECTQLKAPPVALQFPGRQGQVTRKKSVAADRRPSEVLSEGEQKVIALADVLAEVGQKQTSAPIVFDDPVNSLDYKRLEYVVDRLVTLSEQRQVIVFTHNIWFATLLLSRFDKKQSECAYYDIQSDSTVCGVVTKGTHPRADTYANLRGKINELVQGAKRQTGESQTALVEKAYEHLRNLCEVIVEGELLQGVIRRYEPNVRMTSLVNIKCEKLPEAIKTVNDVYDRACRYIASHSQPLETLNVRPSLECLERDWAAVQKVHMDVKV